ncbi:MAG: cob(I)yrinic acid a,c-diamide adenosyltransferase [Candidatus Abawacabacteria bacterium]|nr:cob(I)yrinic acid a,c-diamide adenosyltransferase [Candidatus Abawacabacteria bacterium]
MIQIYTGKGKGKTTAGLGLAIRAFGQGLKVAIIYFDKGGEDYGERKILSQIGLDFFPTGLNRRNSDGSFRFSITPEDTLEAERGLTLATTLLTKGYDLLVLDEINSTVALKMLSTAAVCDFIKKVPSTMEVVLTGRNVPEEMMALADLITEMKPIKHYMEKGVPARRGIEF